MDNSPLPLDLMIRWRETRRGTETGVRGNEDILRHQFMFLPGPKYYQRVPARNGSGGDLIECIRISTSMGTPGCAALSVESDGKLVFGILYHPTEASGIHLFIRTVEPNHTFQPNERQSDAVWLEAKWTPPPEDYRIAPELGTWGFRMSSSRVQELEDAYSGLCKERDTRLKAGNTDQFWELWEAHCDARDALDAESRRELMRIRQMLQLVLTKELVEMPFNQKQHSPVLGGVNPSCVNSMDPKSATGPSPVQERSTAHLTPADQPTSSSLTGGLDEPFGIDPFNPVLEWDWSDGALDDAAFDSNVHPTVAGTPATH